MRAFILLLACSVLSPSLTRAQTVTLHPDRDNTLFEHLTGDLSNGAGAGVFAGTNGGGLVRRGLVRFPVAASVPPGMQVTSAVLRLHSSMGQVQPQPFTVHRVLQAWGEGTSNATFMGGGGGAPSAPGDATWVHTFFPSASWTLLGGDFDAAELASASAPAFGWTAFGPTAGLTQLVRDWATGFEVNEGLMIRGVETGFATAVRFDSREHADVSVRPELVLTLAPTADVAAGFRGPLALRAAGAVPFRDLARLELALARETDVTVAVYDVRGARRGTLHAGPLGPGAHALTWDGRDAAGRACDPGLYLVRADSPAGTARLRLVRVR